MKMMKTMRRIMKNNMLMGIIVIIIMMINNDKDNIHIEGKRDMEKDLCIY